MNPILFPSAFPLFVFVFISCLPTVQPIPHINNSFSFRSLVCPVKLPNDPPSAPDLLPLLLDSNQHLPRIINGDLASDSLRPYLASLLILTSPSSNVSCTATLVSPRWLITAAHCIITSNILVSVATNRSLRFQEQPFIRVAANKSHPQYSSVEAQYDVGLLQLAQPAPAHAKFMKVSVDATIPLVSSYARSIGYGSSISDPDTTETLSVAGYLRQVDVPVITKQSCKLAYRDYRRIIDYDAQVCTGYANGGCGAW